MMKRFLIDIIFVFVCFCAVWLAGEMVFDKYKGQNNYSYKYNYVKNNLGIKILLIGHSQFENGVNPYLLGDSVFNFAISGRGRWLGWDVELAKDLFPAMHNLKTVIFPLNYNAPYFSPHYRKPIEGIEKEFIYFYSRYMYAPYDCFPQNIIYSSALYFNKMGPNYWLDTDVDSLGFYPFEGQMENWENSHNVKDDAFYTGINADLCYEEFINNIIELAKICYQNKIRYIMVTPPYPNAFVRNTKPEQIQKMLAIIDSVKVHYPVEFKNYMNDKEFRTDSIYYNAAHLNAIGADLFTRRLKMDFKL